MGEVGCSAGAVGCSMGCCCCCCCQNIYGSGGDGDDDGDDNFLYKDEQFSSSELMTSY